MNKSINYGLNLPEGADYYNVNDFNENFEIIDEEIKKKYGKDNKPTAIDVEAVLAVPKKTPTNTGYNTLLEYLRFLKDEGYLSVSMTVSAFSDLPRTDWEYGCEARLSGNIQVQIWRFLSGGSEGILLREMSPEGTWINDWTTAYLPLDGSVPMTGLLQVKGGYGRFLADTGYAQITTTEEPNNTDNCRGFIVKNNKSEPLKNSAQVFDKVAGVVTYYKLFGEHNKDLMAESFLPLTGGTLIGTGMETLKIERTVSGTVSRVGVGINGYKFNGGYPAIITLNRDGTQVAYLQFNETGIAFKDGVNQKTYNIFGEHNKPSGKYTGNGSSTERVINLGIDVGDSEVLVLHSIHGSVIVTKASGLTLTESTSANIPYSKVHLEKEKNGLVINSNTMELNQSGTTYYYRVL